MAFKQRSSSLPGLKQKTNPTVLQNDSIPSVRVNNNPNPGIKYQGKQPDHQQHPVDGGRSKWGQPVKFTLPNVLQFGGNDTGEKPPGLKQTDAMGEKWKYQIKKGDDGEDYIDGPDGRAKSPNYGLYDLPSGVTKEGYIKTNNLKFKSTPNGSVVDHKYEEDVSSEIGG
jgi:hypothetical protein